MVGRYVGNEDAFMIGSLHRSDPRWVSQPKITLLNATSGYPGATTIAQGRHETSTRATRQSTAESRTHRGPIGGTPWRNQLKVSTPDR